MEVLVEAPHLCPTQVSPAVVVPSLLDLQLRGYGTKTGIPTLVVAAAALDDVFALAGFGVSLSFAVSDASGGGVRPRAAKVRGGGTVTCQRGRSQKITTSRVGRTRPPRDSTDLGKITQREER